MPVSSVYAENHWFREDFPVMQHHELCPGTLEKTRAFRSDFDYSSLSIDPQVSECSLGLLLDLFMSVLWGWINMKLQAIRAYQNTVPGSLPWKLRLLELVVMSCHDIAILLYRLDNGVHKHADWTSWRQQQLDNLPEHCSQRERSKCGSPTLFYANQYSDAKRFPQGLADVAGYWAELRIFGGVVLFDRGQNEDEVSFYEPNLALLCQMQCRG